MHSTIEQWIDDLTTLTVQSKFHDYSNLNTLLITDYVKNEVRRHF